MVPQPFRFGTARMRRLEWCLSHRSCIRRIHFVRGNCSFSRLRDSASLSLDSSNLQATRNFFFSHANEAKLESRRTFCATSNMKRTSEKLNRNISIIDEDADKIIRQIPLQDVRNFCLVAHIDAGKSSLSSRILELTGNLGPEAQKVAQAAAEGLLVSSSPDNALGETEGSKTKSIAVTCTSQKEQYELFDTLSVEQQRGITIKASTATMLYPHPSAVGPTGVLLLNLIDTPGHVDFGREGIGFLFFFSSLWLLYYLLRDILAQHCCDCIAFYDTSPADSIICTGGCSFVRCDARNSSTGT